MFMQGVGGAGLVLGQGAPADGSFVSTVWDMIVRGGWFMVPLAACSLVAMTIIVERLIVTRRARVVPRGLLESLTSLRHRPREAVARCQSDPSPLAAVILAAVRTREQGREAQENAVSEAGEREVRKLRHRMRVLSSLPQVATMLGLLGTVLGMIRTFTTIAASGDSLGKTERLAQGIHEAWTATAGGLFIAIPTLLFFHIIMGRIDAAAAALDSAATLWLEADSSSAGEEAPGVVREQVAAEVVAVGGRELAGAAS
ncbi:MAG TPA: MotA/TolQ/ExbB proton channel family protein [Phycisphaerales bacterium]|nr:MotA/TolQ/ExbB proton channel family protein [Phycisphaerales bacterium]